MNQNTPMNVFGSSAKKQKKKAEKDPSSPPTGSYPPPPTTHRTRTSVKIPTLNPEVTEMLNRMDSMRRELEDKVNEIVQKSGWSKDRVWGFLNKTKQFKQEQWEKMENEVNSFNLKVWTSLGWEWSVKTPKHDVVQHVSQEKKARMIGGRRRWIPMR
jgi:hypothetical protein